jgi:hypothetical protein
MKIAIPGKNSKTYKLSGYSGRLDHNIQCLPDHRIVFINTKIIANSQIINVVKVFQSHLHRFPESRGQGAHILHSD